MPQGNSKKYKVIRADIELIEILDKLEKNVKDATWDGLGKVTYRDLTRILARKVKDAKLV